MLPYTQLHYLLLDDRPLTTDHTCTGRKHDVVYRPSSIVCRRAANQNHHKAQFNLGALLYNGAAGEPDLGEVCQWWTLAAMQGHPSAQQNLEIITGKLSQEQLARTQAAVAEFMHRLSA